MSDQDIVNAKRVLALLGRPEQDIDLQPVRESLRGRRVLVTGAGGSIGRQLCVQLLQFEVAELIAVDQSEGGLYELSLLTTASHPTRLTLRLDNCCELSAWQPRDADSPIDVFFHVAAHKHVPLLEANARAAVLNNVGAVLTMIEAVQNQSPAHAVLVSSDKAVNASAVMGQTKRCAERMVQSASDPLAAGIATPDLDSGYSNTHWKTLRLANVLGSSGSVLPRFEKSLARGEALTWHGAESTRFFISPREAVGAILAATTLGRSGDLVAANPGPALPIRALAENLAREQGRPPRELNFEVVPLRPGDRTNESLWHEGELAQPSDSGQLLLCRPLAGAGLNASRVRVILDELGKSSNDQARRVLRDLLS